MATLYFKYGDNGNWENPLNWFTDLAGTIQADNAPWVDGIDSKYLDYDLKLATGSASNPQMDPDGAYISYGANATGVCYMSVGGYSPTVNGGTYIGGISAGEVIINGGVFTTWLEGMSFLTINGGTWATNYKLNDVTYGPYNNPGFTNTIPLLDLDASTTTEILIAGFPDSVNIIGAANL